MANEITAANLPSATECQRLQCEGRRMPLFSGLAIWAYGLNRRIICEIVLSVIKRFEGGEELSLSLREIFRRYHDVKIGLYSFGGCFVPGNHRPMTIVGRYCSIDQSVRTFNANHPQNLVSSHAYFFNPALGVSKNDLVTRTQLTIGSDVTIGHNASVVASTSKIGTGAIIRPNTVVYQDVLPYAIIEGNPGRVVAFRFPKEIIAQLLESKWWELPLDDLKKNKALFQISITTENATIILSSISGRIS